MNTLSRYVLLSAVWLALLVTDAAAATTSTAVKCLILALTWTAAGGYYTVYLAYHTLPRDIKAAYMILRMLLLYKAAEWRNETVPKLLARTVARVPNKVMCHFQDQQWTFSDMESYSNRVAQCFLAKGFKKGDCIALFMENRPEYIGMWLGLAKIGVTPALVNSSLRLDSLVHSVHVAKARAVIFGAEMTQAVRAVVGSLKNGSTTFPTFCSAAAGSASSVGADLSGGVPGCVDLDSELDGVVDERVPDHVRDSIEFNDNLMYIYTSGTTGLPKAAVIKHSRYIFASFGNRFVIGCRPSDVIYCPLPLYHTAAGMLGLAGPMKWGSTIVLKRKFSASNYWSDCVKYRATVGQYIGEICRYLLNTAECEAEKTHTLRLMFGNGLRPEIWEQFVRRFRLQNITEFYGATEGNSNIVNFSNRVGAVGFVPVLLPGILPLGLVRVDRASGRALRGADGLCVPCKAGEPGEFVGRIDRGHPTRDFHGYANADHNERKLLRDVYRTDDVCFRSGDILVADQFGWLYFKDRLGDTFRWHGENVSTTEVESTVSPLVERRAAVVYGVPVPDADGRCGMLAVHDPDGRGVDLGGLADGIRRSLPAFAWPMFLRIVHKLDITGTFKVKKFKLQAEGFDPSFIADQLYFLHPKTGAYESLTHELFVSIVSGAVRF